MIPSTQAWLAGGERVGYDPKARAPVRPEFLGFCDWITVQQSDSKLQTQFIFSVVFLAEFGPSRHEDVSTGMAGPCLSYQAAFDPATIRDHANFEKPRQLATGISEVFVNGVQVVHNGEHTGAKPGRVVKRDRI